jgi:DNA polymerase III epsilon subunit-like protein
MCTVTPYAHPTTCSYTVQVLRVLGFDSHHTNRLCDRILQYVQFFNKDLPSAHRFGYSR